jgi:hypothetical protein
VKVTIHRGMAIGLTRVSSGVIKKEPAGTYTGLPSIGFRIPGSCRVTAWSGCIIQRTTPGFTRSPAHTLSRGALS